MAANESFLELRTVDDSDISAFIKLQAVVRGVLVRKLMAEIRQEYEDIVNDLDQGLTAVDWPDSLTCPVVRRKTSTSVRNKNTMNCRHACDHKNNLQVSLSSQKDSHLLSGKVESVIMSCSPSCSRQDTQQKANGLPSQHVSLGCTKSGTGESYGSNNERNGEKSVNNPDVADFLPALERRDETACGNDLLNKNIQNKSDVSNVVDESATLCEVPIDNFMTSLKACNSSCDGDSFQSSLTKTAVVNENTILFNGNQEEEKNCGYFKESSVTNVAENVVNPDHNASSSLEHTPVSSNLPQTPVFSSYENEKDTSPPSSIPSSPKMMVDIGLSPIKLVDPRLAVEQIASPEASMTKNSSISGDDETQTSVTLPLTSENAEDLRESNTTERADVDEENFISLDEGELGKGDYSEIPDDKESLLALKKTMTLELLWIQQAINSRRDYLKLKHQLTP